ncbi:MAG: hypothetical protein ACHQK8_04010, partial [Bacteroidia bacterium]
MKKNKIPAILNVVFFAVTLTLQLTLPSNDPPEWPHYPDCLDYLYQSKIPLSSPEFYAPHPN